MANMKGASVAEYEPLPVSDVVSFSRQLQAQSPFLWSLAAMLLRQVQLARCQSWQKAGSMQAIAVAAAQADHIAASACASSTQR